MFAQAAACIRSEHQRLTELDSIGGDGDHGTTMLRAAEQIERGIEESSTASLTDLLKAVGWRFWGSMEAPRVRFWEHFLPAWGMSSLARML
jgi:dihydroxyacetone kinase